MFVKFNSLMNQMQPLILNGPNIISVLNNHKYNQKTNDSKCNGEKIVMQSFFDEK